MERSHGLIPEIMDAILKCSQCGFCRAFCPLFGVTIRPAFNARGKMLILKEIINGQIQLCQELTETIFQCTTCGSCAQNCPSGVNVPEIIKLVRQEMVNQDYSPSAFLGLNSVLESTTNIYAEKEANVFTVKRPHKAKYVFFIGCVGAYREEECTEETIQLFDRLRIDYTLIDEACCSGVLEDVGYKIIEKHATHNIERIIATGAHTVITGCPYCSRTLNSKKQYQNLKNSRIKVIVLSQFLNEMHFGGISTDKCVTYHDPCDLGRHCNIFDEPRQFIKSIAPNFIELPHNREQSICCGAGGGVRGAFPKNSIAMARKRLEEVEKVKADILLTDCNSCVHNLKNAKLRRQKFEIYNTAQFLNKILEGKV